MSSAARGRLVGTTSPHCTGAAGDRIRAAVVWIVEQVARPRRPELPSCAGGGCPGCGECIPWYTIRAEQ